MEAGTVRAYQSRPLPIRACVRGVKANPHSCSSMDSIRLLISGHYRVMRLARRQRECYGRSSICGNHMNLGGPTASRQAPSPGGLILERPSHRGAL